METKRFKTTAKCSGCVNAIAVELNKIVKSDDWAIDLSTPDSILTVKSDVSDSEIVNAVKSAGYGIEKL